MAATINDRINNPPIDATIGTTALFFFFLHESDPHRFGLSPTLEILVLIIALKKRMELKVQNNFEVYH
jgi:hypothetical protein